MATIDESIGGCQGAEEGRISAHTAHKHSATEQTQFKSEQQQSSKAAGAQWDALAETNRLQAQQTAAFVEIDFPLRCTVLSHYFTASALHLAFSFVPISL